MSNNQNNGLRAGMAPTAFAGRTQAWHKVWNPLNEENSRNFEGAMKAGDLDWGLRKLQFSHPETGEKLPVYGIFADDNNKFLAEVRDRYEPIDNRTALNFLEELIDADDMVVIDSLGHFQDRRKVFANLQVGEVEIVPGDLHKIYYQFVTSHDGSMPLRVFSSYTRMVCGNTVKMAMSSAEEKLSIRHTESAVIRMENAVEWLKLAGQEQGSFNQKLAFLSQKRVSAEMTEIFLDRLIGKVQDNPKINKGGLPRKDEKKELREKILAAEGVDGIRGISGTYYELFNKVTNAYDHILMDRTRNKEGLDTAQSHAVDVSFGKKSEKKTQAFEIALKMAQSN